MTTRSKIAAAGAAGSVVVAGFLIALSAPPASAVKCREDGHSLQVAESPVEIDDGTTDSQPCGLGIARGEPTWRPSTDVSTGLPRDPTRRPSTDVSIGLPVPPVPMETRTP